MLNGYHIRLALHRNIIDDPDIIHTFTPKALFQSLPLHHPKPTARRNALFNPAHKDYRFGPIRLDWIDFEIANSAMYAGKEKQAGRGASNYHDITRTRVQAACSMFQAPRQQSLSLIRHRSSVQRICLRAQFMYIANVTNGDRMVWMSLMNPLPQVQARPFQKMASCLVY
jgi:hypothetical protein